jgi:hypothetical protein
MGFEFFHWITFNVFGFNSIWVTCKKIELTSIQFRILNSIQLGFHVLCTTNDSQLTKKMNWFCEN